MKLTEKEIDLQIESAEKDIAAFSQKLFQAQGVLDLARHIKKTFELDKEEKQEIVTSSPA